MLEEEQKMEEEKETCKVLDGQYIVHACKDSFVRRSPTIGSIRWWENFTWMNHLQAMTLTSPDA
jgi:hypothetical protein